MAGTIPRDRNIEEQSGIIHRDNFEVTVLGCLLFISLVYSVAGKTRSKQCKCAAHYAESSQDPFQRGQHALPTEGLCRICSFFSVWVTELSANQLLPRIIRKTQKPTQPFPFTLS